MTIQGPQFTDIQPRQFGGTSGQATSYEEARLTPNFGGLDNQALRQFVSQTFNRFRIGQSIFFEFRFEIADPGSIDAILLMPWWLRPQQEFRAIGPRSSDYLPSSGLNLSVDEAAFGPVDTSLAGTDRLWQTDTKREDQQGPPIPAFYSYSNMLDNVWRFPINTNLVNSQTGRVDFTKSFYWPAHGYALAFTSEVEGSPGSTPFVGISWKTGATHSITQEGVE